MDSMMMMEKEKILRTLDDYLQLRRRHMVLEIKQSIRKEELLIRLKEIEFLRSTIKRNLKKAMLTEKKKIEELSKLLMLNNHLNTLLKTKE